MKNDMLKIKLAILLFCCAAVLFGAGCDDFNPFEVDGTKYRAEETFSFSVNPDNQERLAIRAINGSVEIIGVPGASTVEISGLRIVNAESIRDAEKYLGRLNVNIRMSGDEVAVETEQPSSTNGREFIVEYHVRVPASWDIVLNHTNGEVKVDSIAGAVDIDHTNGNIRLSEITGDVFVDLTNGQVNARVGAAASGVCKMSLVNGQILLSIPKTTDAAFSAAVTNGRVSVKDLALTNMTSRQNAVNGTLGNGQGEINLRLVNGNIDVSGY
ncbi:MAG: DUF4097 family beta strand repeat-containing protein [bacterium]